MSRWLTTLFLVQVIDFRDVSFQSLSNNKVRCVGAKPSAEPLPEKLLLLASKVWQQSAITFTYSEPVDSYNIIYYHREKSFWNFFLFQFVNYTLADPTCTVVKEWITAWINLFIVVLQIRMLFFDF